MEDKKTKQRKPMSEETRRKISNALTGKKHSEESRKKMSKSKKGRKLSEEHRKNIGIGLQGRQVSEETREKLRNRPFYKTLEHREKLRNGRLGKKHSEETKIKIGNLKRGKKLSEEHIAKLRIVRKNPSMETREKLREAASRRIDKIKPLLLYYAHNMTDETKAKISAKLKGITRSEETKEKMRSANLGKTHSKETKNKIGNIKSGSGCSFWKGGVSKEDLPLYDTYKDRLVPVEEVRRNPDNLEILQVKCTYCGKWFTPKASLVYKRITAINTANDSNRFYHPGTNCKSQCPIYRQLKYPKNYKPASSREVQPELRQLVFKRDNYICQKCGKDIYEVSLHCHHYEGILINPLESADVDMCITLCKTCHKFVHTLPDCSYHDMKCKEVKNGGEIA